MDTIMEFECQDKDIINDIHKFVDSEELEFNDSLLYSIDKQEKILDMDVRQSKFALIKKKELFKIFKAYLDKINEKLDDESFKLIMNDITYIKYEEGDFFNSHQDYLTYNTNNFQEYTMILCYDSDCEGGETSIQVNKFFKHDSKASITNDNALIFRKDLFHSGNKLTKGHKHILVANLIKIDKKDDDIVVVSFKDGKYILPKSNVFKFENALKSKLSFSENNVYEMDDICDLSDFQVIYDIFMRKTISLKNYYKYEDLINYLCIDKKNIITTLISEEDIEDKKVKHFFKLKYDKDDDVILVGKHSEFTYLKNNLEEDNITDFLPVKLEFIEGSSRVNGEESSSIFKYLKGTVYDSVVYTDSLYKHANNKLELDEASTMYLVIMDDCDDRDDNDSDNDYYKDESDNSDDGEDSDTSYNEDNIKSIIYKLQNYKKVSEIGLDKINSIINKYINFIKKNIKTITFNFVQESVQTDGALCNESFYGNINYITVYGFIKC